RQDMLRNVSGGRLDPALLDSQELRLSVLDNLVQQQLLMQRAVRSGLAVSDRQIQEIVANVYAFMADGNFSYARYERVLQAQGMTPLIFEQRVRQDILVDHVTHPYAGCTFVSRAEAALLLRISQQQREVSHFTFSADRFLPQVKLEP